LSTRGTRTKSPASERRERARGGLWSKCDLASLASGGGENRTTNDWRDNWTLGYTPEFVTGVWVGNANNSEMEHISGVTGAGPLWHNFMERALAGKPTQEFLVPSGMVRVEVCDESGLLPTEYCPTDHRHTEIFLAEQAPIQQDNVWQKIKVDRTNNLLGTELCPDLIDEKIFAVYPPDARQWAIDHNIPQPPTDYSPNCPIPAGPTATPGPKPVMAITSPRDGNYISAKHQSSVPFRCQTSIATRFKSASGTIRKTGFC